MITKGNFIPWRYVGRLRYVVHSWTMGRRDWSPRWKTHRSKYWNDYRPEGLIGIGGPRMVITSCIPHPTFTYRNLASEIITTSLMWK